MVAIMKLIKTTILVTTLFIANQAYAEGLRCNGGIIQSGDDKASVLLKCGEPMMKDSYCKSAAATSDGNECEKIETWTYNPGSGKFLTTLKFSQGKITSIEYGSRVP
jgi:hypothetical protein